MQYDVDAPADALFPAWAGVILSCGGATILCATFPRMGGGDPDIISVLGAGDDFSPHGRG